MKSGYDINKISGDGYLICPLSIARLSSSQSVDETYNIFEYFLNKLEEFGSDVILLYTGGLYLNSDKSDYNLRQKINQKIMNHLSQLRKKISKEKRFIPGAFHYIPIDYVIMNSISFIEFFSKLKKLEKEDKEFKNYIKKDLNGREYNEANVNFIIEEIVVAHIIRQKMVEFPRGLVKKDVWRLIVYPGKYLESDVYQWQKSILPKEEKENPFKGSQYDFSEKKLYLFDNIKLK